MSAIHSAVEVLNSQQNRSSLLTKLTGVLGRQTLQLKTLVDDLLEVSRITRGKFHLRKDNIILQTVLNNAVEAVTPLLDHHHHQLVLDIPKDPYLLYGDPYRLTQIFSNLLNNAAKFTPPGGMIELRVVTDEQGARVYVRDSGVGIPDEKIEEIFEMFSQGESFDSSRHGGLGIGLTLAKSLVEMHQGTIKVQSFGLNRGSEFEVWVPHSLKERKGQQEISAKKENIKGTRKVLIAEDSPDVRELLKLRIEQFGHNVFTANDGLEAIEKAIALKPDVILMDLGMPHCDGFEATRKIRKEVVGRSMKIVALTGWDHDDFKKRTREEGFDLHLVKPANTEDLLAAIELGSSEV